MTPKLGWALGAGFCLAVTAGGAFVAWFGSEALVTGANVAGWLLWFFLLVVLPLTGCIFCLVMLVKPRDGNGPVDSSAGNR